ARARAGVHFPVQTNNRTPRSRPTQWLSWDNCGAKSLHKTGVRKQSSIAGPRTELRAIQARAHALPHVQAPKWTAALLRPVQVGPILYLFLRIDLLAVQTNQGASQTEITPK